MVVGLRADARLVAVWIGCIVSLFISLDTPVYIYVKKIKEMEIEMARSIYIYICTHLCLIFTHRKYARWEHGCNVSRYITLFLTTRIFSKCK